MSHPKEAKDRPRAGRLDREFADVWQTLGHVPAPELGGTIWPHVSARVRRAQSPAARVTFAVTAAAAGLVGLLIGVELGGGPFSEPASAPASPWSETGSLLADGSDPTLVDVYLAEATQTDPEEVITP